MVGTLIPPSSKPTVQVISGVSDFENFWYIESQERRRGSKKLKISSNLLSCGAIVMFMILIMVVWPVLGQINIKELTRYNKFGNGCDGNCSFEIVESIPEGLYPNTKIKSASTFETWKKLINIAEHSIEISSFYWTLKKSDEFPVESAQGDEIFNSLLDAGLNRNITIKIAQNKPSSLSTDDTEILMAKKAAQVKFLDFDALIGNGVLHTKFWIVDRKHFYIGSANLDWRALTQVKELGIAFYNCSCLAGDLGKIFDVYWTAGNTTSLPMQWPNSLSTSFNSKNPFKFMLNGQQTAAFISSAPPQISAKGRNDDLDALLMIIRNAKKFIHISVMNYLPLVLHVKELKFWSLIDDELRRAVIDRNIKVRLMTSKWRSTRPMETNFLRSLTALNNFRNGSVLDVKQFEVPSTSTQSKIPYARVNHNKYMVTDNGAFIGTSNWSGDYFLYTAGVSLVVPTFNNTPNVIQQQLLEIFDRDWNSPYVHSLPPSRNFRRQTSFRQN